MLPRQSIDLDEQLKPGDIIELDFRTTTWVWSQSAEIALIEAYCDNRDDWEILSNTLPEDNRITFKVKVLSSVSSGVGPYETAGYAITGRTISAVIIAAGLTTWLVLLGVYLVERGGTKFVESTNKLASTTGGQAALVGAGAIGIAILIAVLGKYIKLKVD